MAKNPLVSIIVPIYNPPREFLSIALDSIKSQDYNNIEVILVDDGSDSSTAQYLDSYVADLQNWKLIHKKNGGLSSARNRGYELAEGEYVQFLDADDYFDKILISSAVRVAQKFDAEIVIENFIAKDYSSQNLDERTVLDKSDFPRSGTFSLMDISGSRLETIPYNVWSKMFNKSFLDKYSLTHNESLARCEDVLFSYSALINSKKISFLATTHIIYRENIPTSNSRNNDNHATDSIVAWEELKSILRQAGKYETLKQDYEYAMLGSIQWHYERMRTAAGRMGVVKASEPILKSLDVASSHPFTEVVKLTMSYPSTYEILRENSIKIEMLVKQTEDLREQVHGLRDLNNTSLPKKHIKAIYKKIRNASGL